MDEERKRWLLDGLRFLFSRTSHDGKFDLPGSLDRLIELHETEPDEQLKTAILYQAMRLHELGGRDRSEAISGILELARAGVRCCANPLCPINFAIDVATAALATES